MCDCWIVEAIPEKVSVESKDSPSLATVAPNSPRAGVDTDGTSSYPFSDARNWCPWLLPEPWSDEAMPTMDSDNAMRPASVMRSTFILAALLLTGQPECPGRAPL